MESKLFTLLLTRLILVIATFGDFAIGMGLCEFDELLACKNGGGCHLGISGKSETVSGSTQKSTSLLTTHRPVNNYSTTNPLSISQTIPGSTRHTTTVMDTHRSSNNYSTSDPLIISETVSGSNKDTTPLLTTHRPVVNNSTTNVLPPTPICPPNMVYTNCTCHGTCQDPSGCHVNCSNIETCVCPSGFLMKGDSCVTLEECGCFIEGYGVLKDNGVYGNSVCSKRCTCAADTLSCNNSFSCDTSAVCEENNNLGQCVCNASFTGDGSTCEGPHSDCFDIFSAGNTDDGVYTIIPDLWPGPAFEVYCDMSNGGGWTVFQRRVNGSEDFNRTWDEYKAGFGDLTHEFWIGNTKLYYLTRQPEKPYQLRIDVVNEYDVQLNLIYDAFSIMNKFNNFRLGVLGNFTGSADYNYMEYHKDQEFSAFDVENDVWPKDNCASKYGGGWWYKNCFTADLNGEYLMTNGTGVRFHNWDNKNNSLHHYTQMKIRPT